MECTKMYLLMDGQTDHKLITIFPKPVWPGDKAVAPGEVILINIINHRLSKPSFSSKFLTYHHAVNSI